MAALRRGDGCHPPHQRFVLISVVSLVPKQQARIPASQQAAVPHVWSCTGAAQINTNWPVEQQGKTFALQAEESRISHLERKAQIPYLGICQAIKGHLIAPINLFNPILQEFRY